jgi:hypothetical protein
MACGLPHGLPFDTMRLQRLARCVERLIAQYVTTVKIGSEARFVIYQVP